MEQIKAGFSGAWTD